ncbi:MAG: site-2 protease family protein [Defluviitaleaceae bacterium]|nr:site-2 protease family protein [Defluviitaleaceae bacterium]
MVFLLLLPGAFFAPIIHEWVKARTSAALGDPTPKKNGFISMNPLRFFEPIGFFMMLYFRVGWGQPITTSPFYYKDKRKGILLTYTTPIVANLLVGMLTIFIGNLIAMPLMEWAVGNFGFMGAPVQWVRYFNTMVYLFGHLNIRLAVFNLIPVFPMAMNKILHVFVSPDTSMRLNHYEKPMQILMFLLLIFGVLESIISPIAWIFERAVSF